LNDGVIVRSKYRLNSNLEVIQQPELNALTGEPKERRCRDCKESTAVWRYFPIAEGNKGEEWWFCDKCKLRSVYQRLAGEWVRDEPDLKAAIKLVCDTDEFKAQWYKTFELAKSTLMPVVPIDYMNFTVTVTPAIVPPFLPRAQ